MAYSKRYPINWTKDASGDRTSQAVRKLDDENAAIYQILSNLMHAVNGHRHSGRTNDAPRIFELTRYK